MNVNKLGNFVSIPLPQQDITPAVYKALLECLTFYITESKRDWKTQKLEFVKVPYTFYSIAEDNVFGKALCFSGGFFERVISTMEEMCKIHCNINDTTVTLFDNDEEKYINAYSYHNDLIPEGTEFRHRQKEVIDTITENNQGRIVCPTGWGKSFVIAMLCITHPYAKIVVTTHTLSVLTQLYEDIRKYTADVGIQCSKIKRNLNARILCVGAKSVGNCLDPDKVDYVFADEVHELGTQNNYNTFQKFSRARMYGFSANDKKQNGAHAFMEAMFGQVLTEVKYQEAVKSKSVVQLEVRWIPVKMRFNPVLGVTNTTTKERLGVWSNEYRNKLISIVANKHKDDQVLIMVKTVEHAFRLSKLLPEYTVVYGGNVPNWNKLKAKGVVPKDTSLLSYDRAAAIKRQFSSGELKHVIATSVWNRGVDFKNLRVLFRADGSNSIISDKQIPGRASRIASDKKIGIIYDLTDEFDFGFSGKAKQRRKRYEKEGWMQVEINPLIDT